MDGRIVGGHHQTHQVCWFQSRGHQYGSAQASRGRSGSGPQGHFTSARNRYIQTCHMLTKFYSYDDFNLLFFRLCSCHMQSHCRLHLYHMLTLFLSYAYPVPSLCRLYSCPMPASFIKIPTLFVSYADSVPLVCRLCPSRKVKGAEHHLRHKLFPPNTQMNVADSDFNSCFIPERRAT